MDLLSFPFFNVNILSKNLVYSFYLFEKCRDRDGQAENHVLIVGLLLRCQRDRAKCWAVQAGFSRPQPPWAGPAPRRTGRKLGPSGPVWIPGDPVSLQVS